MKKIVFLLSFFAFALSVQAQNLPNGQVWGSTKVWAITTNNDTSGYATLDQIKAGISSGAGTVTTLSVASANGFAGTVANATTTPVITLTTSVTGLLKGNGTAISAATAGTDFLQTLSGDVTTTGQVATIANGAVTNAKLANSAITINGTSVSLGGTRNITLQDATTAGATTTTASTFSGGLTSSSITTLGGNEVHTPTTLTSNTTLTGTSNNIIYLDATTAFTVTLPSAPTNGTTYRFVKTNTTTTVPTLARGGSDTIMGATSHVIFSARRIVEITYNTGSWYQN
jgi:hypothetical protein